MLKQGTQIQLDALDTRAIRLWAHGVQRTVPITLIGTIEALDNGAILVQPGKIEGQPVFGQMLSGSWNLGRCEVQLRDIQRAEFGQGVQQPPEPPQGKDPSFSAVCTTRAGETINAKNVAFDFSSSGGYTYAWDPPKSFAERQNPITLLPLEYNECVLGVPFADIESIEFADTPPPLGALPISDAGIPLCISPTSAFLAIDLATDSLASLDVQVTFADKNKTVLKGKLARYGFGEERIVGETAWGSVVLPASNAKAIRFARDAGAPRKGMVADLPYPHHIVLNTWDGATVALDSACFVDMEENFRWHAADVCQARIGQSAFSVNLGKIKSIQFQNPGTFAAQVTNASGEVVQAELSLGNRTWIGGVYKDPVLAGIPDVYGRISVQKVRSLEVR